MPSKATLRVLAVVCATFAASASAIAAHATAPGKNGRIAFNRYRYRDDVLWSEVFVANADGSDERKITHAPKGYQDNDPDWSPDGSRIVFGRCAPNEGRCAIWSVKADGTEPKRLSPPCLPGAPPSPRCVDDTGSAYSPDGRSIAFSRFEGRGPSAVIVGDAQFRHLRRVAVGTEPTWSPNGKQLAFARFNDPGTGREPVNGRAIFVVDADGTHLRRLTAWRLKAGDRPDWSPDGTRILFRTMPNGEGDYGGGNVYTIRPDGSGLRQLTHFPPTVRVLQTGSYSPDGASILFMTTAGATRCLGLLPDVFVMSADGTDVRPVTRSCNWDGSPDWGPRP
jgi:Tol biopolymer transport system component